MINAQKDYLRSFFQGSIRFVVPFYQRAYVWEEENWEILWENLWQVVGEVSTNKDAEHFIGTLITKQRVATSLDDYSYELIDGQQRLTTISLLLRAIAESAKGDLPNLKTKTVALISFEDSKGESYQRIEHNRTDAPYFRKVICGEDVSSVHDGESLLVQAFRFFSRKVADLSDSERDLLVNVILSRVPVISMLLSEKDDEQVIFDTINSLGVKLTTAELLKNYLFKEEATRTQYENLWQNIYEADDEQVSFWNSSKTAGRMIRTNIEVLLYCYLMMSTRTEVRLERLFKEYKDWLRDKDAGERLKVLESLRDLADAYASLPTTEDYSQLCFDEHEKRFFYVIDSLNITTAYPLILFLYRSFKEPDRIRQLRILESYLVRRNICKMTTKNYNNLFLSLLQKLDELRTSGGLTADSMSVVLHEMKEATNIFPGDADFQQAFARTLLSNQNARTILVCIALYQQSSDLHDQRRLSPGSLSVEHIMPRKWELHWSEGKMGPAQKEQRSQRILTLGNLTLLNRRLNSRLRNESWEVKREALKQFSSLRMTTKYAESPNWGDAEIEGRGEDLAKAAVEIWPR